MLSEKEKMQQFVTACDEVIGGKYILADRKISALLKTIAASDNLTRLFSAVTEEFDYPATKAECLKETGGQGGRGAAYLPQSRQSALAFIFCLLVDIDSGKIELSDFLLRYFYEDGSYTASYTLFTDRVIRPFRDIVKNCFPALGSNGELRYLMEKEGDSWEKLSEQIMSERARIKRLSLSKEDAMAAEMMLAELNAACGRKDAAETKALLVGYLYFLDANGGRKECEALFDTASKI